MQAAAHHAGDATKLVILAVFDIPASSLRFRSSLNIRHIRDEGVQYGKAAQDL